MSQFGRPGGGMGGFLFPPVLKNILIINVAVFALTAFILPIISSAGFPIRGWFYAFFALQPLSANIIDLNFSSGPMFLPWQLISYQFMHGGFFHLFFNLFALWMFGSELENQWGSKKFLIFYLLSGIGAGITQLVVAPLVGQVGPTVGASGSVYGILLAFGLTHPNRPIFMFPLFIPIPAKYFVLIFTGAELLFGVSNSGSGIAHFAHLGGALAGFLLLKYGDQIGVYNILGQKSFGSSSMGGGGTSSSFSFRQSRPEQRSYSYQMNWQKPKPKSTTESTESPQESSSGKRITIDGEVITQQKIDTILDKISASGYQNLTDHEKYILTELSKKL